MKRFYDTKDTSLARLFQRSEIINLTESFQLQGYVLVEIDDDPLGPPTTMFVTFVDINKFSGELVLKGYSMKDDGKMNHDDFISISTSPNGFVVIDKDGE